MILIVDAAALFTIVGAVKIAIRIKMTKALEYLLTLRRTMAIEMENLSFRY
jgi:hypothetical protein